MTGRLVASAVASLLMVSACSLSIAHLSGSQLDQTSGRLRRRPGPKGRARRTRCREPRGAIPTSRASGLYNDDVNTPFERPAELGGKVEFGDEELAAILEERARRNVERAPTIGGETGAGPTHWYEFWNARSARTSKIIDPPDGRVPR